MDSSDNSIQEFQGAWRFLSNFYPAPVEMDGKIYPTVEHAYQAAKTLDLEYRERIRLTPKASTAKHLGRYAVSPRPDWKHTKISIMRDLVKKKFQHQVLADALRNTGKARLVESNHWNDTFWGQCNGIGQNHLGRILMSIREELTYVQS